jgi:hypothetical protein
VVYCQTTKFADSYWNTGRVLMAKDSKPLCKWDKDEIKDNFKELKKIVSEPRYVCRKCGRAAKKEDNLCKPEEL